MTIVVKDLTLIILAHENPRFLARSVEYYSRLDCQKIIADSSAQPIYSPAIVPEGYDYRHIPLGYYAKQQKIAATIDTPFTLCAGCDDFFVPETLAIFTEFLRRNPDYVSVAGQHIGFSAHDSGYKFFLKHSQEFLHLIGRGASSNTYARLNTALVPPYGFLYSVMRTAAYRELISSRYVGQPLKYVTFNDRYIPLLLAVLGNVGVLPEFFLARSVVAEPLTHNMSRMLFKRVMTEWPEGAMEEYTRMVISVATVLQKENGVPVDMGIAIIDGAVRRTLPRQTSWSHDDPANLKDIGAQADIVDAELSRKGELLIPRRDRFGMPFLGAEYLFPVYRSAAAVREIAACIARHPVEAEAIGK